MDSDEPDKGLDIETKSKALTFLRKACGRYGIVPRSYVLTGVVSDNHLPQKNGITTETWRGTYQTTTVAIKKFKIPEGEEYNKMKAVRQAVRTHFSSLTIPLSCYPQRFCREAVLWKRLTHENILPFMGVSRDIGEFCLISPWMSNGTIMEYIRDNNQINLLELVCTNRQ